mmetsp:Transcript_8679/g.32453  ORF Transcript_8679/g.32453 Transcript_8679/m.32453 type:complete len:486 (+) Transcript_8679:3250-4707(+)
MSSSTNANAPPKPLTDLVIGVCNALSPYTFDPSGRMGGAGTVHISARAPRGTTPQCNSRSSPGKSVSTRTRADAPGASRSTSTKIPTRVCTSTSVNTTWCCSWKANQSTSVGRAGVDGVDFRGVTTGVSPSATSVSTEAAVNETETEVPKPPFFPRNPNRPILGRLFPDSLPLGPASTNAALSCNSFATRRFCSFLESFCAFTGSVYASSSSSSDVKAESVTPTAAATAAAAFSTSSIASANFFSSSFFTSTLRLKEESVPSKDAMPFGPESVFSFLEEAAVLLEGVSSATTAAAAAASTGERTFVFATADSASSKSTATSSSSSSSSGSSGSGSAGVRTRKKSPLCWWYHWLYFLSCSTKFRACGACSTAPSITTRATDFGESPDCFDCLPDDCFDDDELPTPSSLTGTRVSGVWQTSASMFVPLGRMALGGMVHVSGFFTLATPQCSTRSAAESVSTVTLKLTPLDCTSTLTSEGRYSRIAMS